MKPLKQLTVKDLKPAGYNPRVISNRQLKGLADSIATMGDLSGVVWNQRTGALVSGHQRMKTTEGKRTKIVTQPYEDAFGTIAMGYVEVHEAKGINKIPLRIVDWSDKKVEMAANIAANAHGGDFDRAKLKKVLAKLEDATFDIELVGLDPLLIRSIQSSADDSQIMSGPSGKNDTPQSQASRKDNAFPSYDEESFSHDTKCPKCGYEFNAHK